MGAQSTGGAPPRRPAVVQARRGRRETAPPVEKRDLTMLHNAPIRRVGCCSRGDASSHAVGRHGVKLEVVHNDGRGVRVSDDIYQSSKTKVERPSDRASATDRSSDRPRREKSTPPLQAISTAFPHTNIRCRYLLSLYQPTSSGRNIDTCYRYNSSSNSCRYVAQAQAHVSSRVLAAQQRLQQRHQQQQAA